MTDKEWHEREHFDPEFKLINFLMDKHYTIVNTYLNRDPQKLGETCRQFLTNRISEQEYAKIKKRGIIQRKYRHFYLLKLKTIALPASAGAFTNWEEFRDGKVEQDL